MLGVVGEENSGNFFRGDVEKVLDVFGSGSRVANDMFSLGENIGKVIAAVGGEG
jgi:hypothetical protein